MEFKFRRMVPGGISITDAAVAEACPDDLRILAPRYQALQAGFGYAPEGIIAKITIDGSVHDCRIAYVTPGSNDVLLYDVANNRFVLAHKEAGEPTFNFIQRYARLIGKEASEEKLFLEIITALILNPST